MIDSEPCPNCHTVNWFSAGDTGDYTQPDLEALECWQCHTKFWLPGAEDIRDTLLASKDFNGPDEIIIEKGTKTPNEAAYGENED